MLPEAYKDTLVDSLANAFPDKTFYRDWNDFMVDDTDLIHIVSFGGTVSLFGVSLGNYIGELETNRNYSRYAYGEVIPVYILAVKRDKDGEDTRRDVQVSLSELEIFIKREFDNIYNNVSVDPYSFRSREERDIGAKLHRIMVLEFKLIYTNEWNDMPPDNPKTEYDVDEIRIKGVGSQIWVKI